MGYVLWVIDYSWCCCDFVWDMYCIWLLLVHFRVQGDINLAGFCAHFKAFASIRLKEVTNGLFNQHYINLTVDCRPSCEYSH